MRKNRTNKGFTIVEITVVIILLAMIAALIVPRMFQSMGKQQRRIAKAQLANIESAVLMFRNDCGRLPTDAEGLDALVEAPEELEEKWKGPYLKRSQLLDPWDRPYEYSEEGQINPNGFDLICYGADGEPDGEGDDADIYND